jgi:hypothetical protein
MVNPSAALGNAEKEEGELHRIHPEHQGVSTRRMGMGLVQSHQQLRVPSTRAARMGLGPIKNGTGLLSNETASMCDCDNSKVVEVNLSLRPKSITGGYP